MSNKNYVYKVVFIEREKSGIYPCYYIGSKTNAIFENGVLVGNRGIYWGSSEDAEYHILINSGEPKEIRILYESESVNDMLLTERELHIINDVVASEKYFNKSIAMVNTYSDPAYATYRHINTGKVARLPRDHKSVLAGEWVGVTKGVKISDSHKEKIMKWAEENDNPFLGKPHSDETKKKMANAYSEWRNNNQEEYEAIINAASDRMKILGSLPKSDEHKRNISESNKNKVTLKNVNTGESVRIDREKLIVFDSEIWMNPYKLSTMNGTVPKIKCEYCCKEFVKSMHTRWHGEKCKEKGNNENC